MITPVHADVNGGFFECSFTPAFTKAAKAKIRELLDSEAMIEVGEEITPAGTTFKVIGATSDVLKAHQALSRVVLH